ncbi:MULTISPECIES: SepM family pheromone-processing serine protease [unclassified Streptococcus]|uniref:SepM family pheromone-processing serine protease n=1 Tax=unclassified Streptococcus TaxID=2608887 RepID=UPI00359DEF3C
MAKLKKHKWWLVPALALIALFYAVFVPIGGYYLEMPGGAYDIRTVLTVNDQEDTDDGSYNFVAVTVSRATVAQMLYAWLTPFTDVSTEEEATGGQSQEDFWRISQFYMETSQNEAIHQALKLAGKDVTISYKGVYVLDVNEDSTFKDILHLADTVTGINGKTFNSSKELIDYVGSQALGDKVTVQYTSQGENLSAEGKIIKLKNGKNGIGIGLVDHTEVSTDVPIDFATAGVGGPSAGLMFTLDIYDQLIDEDLRKGRVIAGTGTIEPDGTVGMVGGVDKKVASAHKIGAKIFFVSAKELTAEEKQAAPNLKSNYEDALSAAKELGTDMTIVPVKTVQDAIAYLKKN